MVFLLQKLYDVNKMVVGENMYYKMQQEIDEAKNKFEETIKNNKAFAVLKKRYDLDAKKLLNTCFMMC